MDITDYKLAGDKKKRKKKPTLRFELDLPDSTDTSCPEYSYVELVRQTLKERESKGQNDPLCQNLLEEEEEKERNEAKAIAQYYEIKYGATAAGQKRKRKDKVRDIVGAGYGYDENDPFVDDSEAYDELVPATLTTQHGGFYINTGKLNFRTVSEESDTGSTSSDDSVPLSHHVAKEKKKFSILHSDDSEKEFKTGDGLVKKKKLKLPKDPAKKKLKVSLNGKDKVSGLKQRTKKMKKSTSLAQKLVAKAKAQQMMSASSVGNSGHPTNGAVQQFKKSLSDAESSVFKTKTGELGQLENKDLVQVAKQATKALMSVGSSKASNATAFQAQSVISNASSSGSKTVNHELPPNLPQKLGDKIESLKKIAQSNEVAGKMKFFSNDVNRILLGIEESAQGLRSKERQGMYQHLAQHLPCSKDTLLKRVKKLHEDDSDQQLKGPIEKLKAGVDAVMKSQIEAYILECDTSKMEKFPDKAAASTDEDDEGEEKSTELPGEKKRNYAPRRKFKWDDNLRNLLCEVVTVKMNHYEKFKSRLKQSAEEYLKSFLELTIKPLWPKPWMQTRTLFKESRSAHERLTNSGSKQKKNFEDSEKIILPEPCRTSEMPPKLTITDPNLDNKPIDADYEKERIASVSKSSKKKSKVKQTPLRSWKDIVMRLNTKDVKLDHTVPKISKSKSDKSIFKQFLRQNSERTDRVHGSPIQYPIHSTLSMADEPVFRKADPICHQQQSSKLHQSPHFITNRIRKRKKKKVQEKGVLVVKPKYKWKERQEVSKCRFAANSKKAPTTSSKESKPTDADPNLKSEAKTALPSAATSLHDDNKNTKKQLSFDTHDVKSRAPILSAAASLLNSAVANVKQNMPKNNVIDLTSGGMEMTASIESEDFYPLVSKATTQSKGSARTTPKEMHGSWKKLPLTDATLKPSKAPTPPSKTFYPSSDNNEKRKEQNSKNMVLKPSMDLIPPMDPKLVQECASDFVKMMMSGQFLAGGTNNSNAYLDNTGVPNLETLSHIFERKSDSAITSKPQPQTKKSDEKFQFKITPKSSAPKVSQKGFQLLDPKVSNAPSHSTDPSLWSKQKGPQASESYKKPQKYPSTQSLPMGSLSTFNARFSAPSAHGLNPGFIAPSESSKHVVQRSKKHVTTAASSSSAQAQSGGYETAGKMQKPSRSPTSNKMTTVGSSLVLPMSRQHYQHPGSSPVQSPIDHGHPLSPMVLSPYSSAGMASAFSAGFNPQVSPFTSSKFQPPVSPVQKYPAVSLPHLNYSGLHSYPQVKVVDIKNTKDLLKQSNISVQGNQSR